MGTDGWGSGPARGGGAGVGGNAVVALAVVLAAGGVAAQEADGGARPAELAVRRAPSAIEVDGRLTEEAWREADPVPLPWEIQPGDNTPAAVATACRITYDDDHLYFGCVAEDHAPHEIRAFLTDRDDVDEQDRVGLMVDPFRDRRRAFAFSVTASGVQEDFVFSPGADDGGAWDAIWDAVGRRTDRGFVVEAAVPFRSLRFPADAGVQSWNFFFWRNRPRSVDTSLRSVPLDRSNQCALCQLAAMHGFVGIQPGRNVELVPAVTATRTDARAPTGARGLAPGAVEPEVGVDARWSLTTDLTLNATLNPDFNQVEADAAQLRSNQQFALFFPERRPFFLEGADLFATPVRAVFTRSIADPSFGAKLTGKGGAWALGALAARDEVTNLIFPGALASGSAALEAGATTFLGRVRRDLGEAHTLGGLLTAREGDGYVNRVVGIDTRVQLAGPLNLSGQVLGSRTRYPAGTVAGFGQPAGTFAGVAASARLDFGTRDWFGWVTADALHPGFRADAGFVTGVDQRGYTWRLQRLWWPGAGSPLTRVGVMGGAGRRDDWSGGPLYSFVFADFNLQGPLQTTFVVNPDYFERVFEGRRFYVSRVNLFGETQPAGGAEIGWFLQFGEELDFANARTSGLVRVSPRLDLRVGRRLDLRLNATFKRITHDGRRVFRERIADLRAIHHLGRRTLVRAVVQLRDIRRDPALYRADVAPRTRSLDTQLLFSYKLNPQSVVFLGYSDASAGREENVDPLQPAGLLRLSRSFFMKLSYAWRP